MWRFGTLSTLLIALAFAASTACGAQKGADHAVPHAEMDMSKAGLPDAEAHQDHNSKHGGVFFMTLDNKHHIEGLLESAGIFEVYLYDDHTKPVSRRELNQTQMTVIWGEQDGAPKIELKPRADGTAFEAHAPGTMLFPVTLTLLVRFPGSPILDKPELFTFPFKEFSRPPKAETHTDAGDH